MYFRRLPMKCEMPAAEKIENAKATTTTVFMRWLSFPASPKKSSSLPPDDAKHARFKAASLTVTDQGRLAS